MFRNQSTSQAKRALGLRSEAVFFWERSWSCLLIVAFVFLASSVVQGQSNFVRGDANGDGVLDVADAIGSLSFQFQGAQVDCVAALDVDDSGAVTIGDSVLVLAFLFTSGADPALPFPGCGPDPTPDALGCDGPVGSCDVPVSILSPVDGASLGSRFVDVAGSLGSLSGPALSVDVNGTAGSVQMSPSGATFEALNVPLVPGANTISVTVSVGVDRVDSAVANVTYTVLGSNNLTSANGLIYAALGGQGLAIMSVSTREFTILAPASGMGSIDDVSVADGLLFALDATTPGRLAVFALADPASPTLVAPTVSVPVSPFAGVSASGGRVTVSGGTSLMTVRSYASTGLLSAGVATIDLGIGQPDALQSADGSLAFVSTDFAGTVGGSGFGITIVQLSDPPAGLVSLDQVGLPGAGFTGGFAAPANFPIESALLPDGGIVTAHGGGLSSIDTSLGALLTTLSLGFSAVNVDTVGFTAFVVGTSGRMSEVDLSNPGAPALMSTTTFAGTGSLTTVVAGDEFVALGSSAGGILVITR